MTCSATQSYIERTTQLNWVTCEPWKIEQQWLFGTGRHRSSSWPSRVTWDFTWTKSWPWSRTSPHQQHIASNNFIGCASIAAELKLKYHCNSFITSHLDHCNSCWQACKAPQVTQQRKWNVAVWLILYFNTWDHVIPGMSQLHWLPVRWWIQFKQCTIMRAEQRDLLIISVDFSMIS